MPRWYFHVHDGKAAFRDPEGSELPDLAAARREALAAAHELLNDGMLSGEDRRGWRVEIASEAGKPLIMVPFSELFRVGSR